MLLVAESDRASDGVIDGNAITSQLEAVTIAIGGGTSGCQETVVVRDTVLDQNRTDWPGVGFGKKIPAIIDVVVSDAAAEDIAWAGGELAGKSVGVFTVIGIKVVEGCAVENQVVGGPFTLWCARRVTAELQSRVAVIVSDAELDSIVIATDKDAVVSGIHHLQSTEMPEVAVEL